VVAVVRFNPEALEVLAVAVVAVVLVQAYLVALAIPLLPALHRVIMGDLQMAVPQFMVQGEVVVHRQ
jgi:hypothetical protein